MSDSEAGSRGGGVTTFTGEACRRPGTLGASLALEWTRAGDLNVSRSVYAWTVAGRNAGVARNSRPRAGRLCCKRSRASPRLLLRSPPPERALRPLRLAKAHFPRSSSPCGGAWRVGGCGAAARGTCDGVGALARASPLRCGVTREGRGRDDRKTRGVKKMCVLHTTQCVWHREWSNYLHHDQHDLPPSRAHLSPCAASDWASWHATVRYARCWP